MKTKAGFTLVELMIIVALIADLALIAVPSFIRSRNAAQETRFINDLRIAVNAFEMYASERNGYPANALPGVMPNGMHTYLARVNWAATNTISGQWEWDHNQNGILAGVSVVFSGADDDVRMAAIDARIDNGILSTGAFRKVSNNRYTHIIE